MAEEGVGIVVKGVPSADPLELGIRTWPLEALLVMEGWSDESMTAGVEDELGKVI